MNKDMKNKVFLVTYTFLLGLILINYKWVGHALCTLWSVLSPFVIGCVIAFILNVIVNMLEGKLFKKFKYGKRPLSVVCSLIIVFGLISVVIFILVPQVKNAGMIFIDNLPEYQENLYEVGEKIGLTSDQLEILDFNNDKLKNELTNIITKNSASLINYSFGFANSVVSAVTNFLIGLVFAIYILMEKENLARQFKKLMNRLLDTKKYTRFLQILDLSNRTFTNFIKVQFIEACILGGLCFVGMLIFGLPYAATISVLIGFTALIPIFGAFIGCVVGAFLIFMINPVEALIFIIFFLVLQQIEGNFIYPKVVGDKIGLPGIWVLAGVTIGGALGGVFGMLVGVPILSVVYALLKEFANSKKSLKEVILDKI